MNKAEYTWNLQIYAHIHITVFSLLTSGYRTENTNSGYTIQYSSILLAENG